MKTALILLSILGMACAFSMKNLHRRIKVEDSEENGVFKFRPRYYLYKHAFFYPPLKRFPVQGNSDSSEENGDGDSSDEEEEEETSNEEENNENSNGNEDEESEADNSTVAATSPGYWQESTPGTESVGLAALQLPKAAMTEDKAPSKQASEDEDDDEEEEDGEEEAEESEAEVDEREQAANGTRPNSTEAAPAPRSTASGAQTSPPPRVPATTAPAPEPTPDEYEATGQLEYDPGYYEVYDEHAQPRGDNYRAYEDEYSYYKGQGPGGYGGHDDYYRQ